MAKQKLDGVAVVMILVIFTLTMYTCTMLVVPPIQKLVVERIPDTVSGSIEFTWRRALDYVTKIHREFRGQIYYFGGAPQEVLHGFKEFWDIHVLGLRRGDRQNYFSSCLRQEALEPGIALPELPSADDVLNTKSSADATLRTQRHYNNHTSPRGVISVGPWGGSGGQPFYMHGASAPRLHSIVLYHSSAIHSLSCEYTLAGDDDYEGPSSRVAGPWGRLPHSYGPRGVRTQIDLRSGEHITAVEGTTGHFTNVPGVVITSLTFRTSAGRTYGPYGRVTAGSSHYFSVPVADGACIVGFWGRSGWLVDAVGVYMKPFCSSSSSDKTAAYKKSYASRHQGRKLV